MDNVLFFDRAGEFRGWLDVNRGRTSAVWLGFYRARVGRDGLTFTDAEEVAGEFGWVGGERKLVDDVSYAVLFTPDETGTKKRRVAPPVAWSAAGERHEMPVLDPEYEQRFREHDDAWSFFAAQPPAYRRTAIWWVMSGRHEATRLRRLEALVDGSARGERLAQLARMR